MLVGSRFPGDTAHWVMNLQLDSYPDTLAAFVEYAIDRSLYAERILGIARSDVGDFSRQFKTRPDYDHRILQSAHDDIAAMFRFRHHRWPLFAQPEQGNPTETLAAWRPFAIEEFRALMHDPRFATGLFDALRFQNKPRGYAGETTMLNVLHQRYYAMYNYVLPHPTPAEEPELQPISTDNSGNLRLL